MKLEVICVIEKPDITDERILSTLQENYSISVLEIDFLPLGLDSSAWAYRVEAENATYFLKLRKVIPNPAGVLIPRLLKHCRRDIININFTYSASK